MDLLEELVEFHSMKVNPRDLVVSSRFIKSLIEEGNLRTAPLVKMYLMFTQYTLDKVHNHVGGPSVAAFLDPGNIASFAKKAEFVQEMEQTLLDLREKTLPPLMKVLPPAQARLHLASFVDLIIRSIMVKPWPKELTSKMAVGRYSKEKHLKWGTTGPHKLKQTILTWSPW